MKGLIVIFVFLAGWALSAAEYWHLAREGKVDIDDRWTGLRHGWVWPIAILGAAVLNLLDRWKARK